MSQRRAVRSFSSFLVVLLLLAVFGSSFERVQAADSQFFPETGFSVSGKFLDYWRANGGLATYGYPITAAQNEVDPETGRSFLTQWFERNRFELHPENAGTPYEVLLGLLGKDLNREALKFEIEFQPTGHNNAVPANQIEFFPATGHNVRFGFLDYWRKNGGVARFGWPLTEEHAEVDPETGKVYSMQWFERARFEYHPENKGTQYEILLGLLGNQLKKPKSNLELAVKLNHNSQTSCKELALGGPGNFFCLNFDGLSKVNSLYDTVWTLDYYSLIVDDQPVFSVRKLAADRSGNFLYAALDNRIVKIDANGRVVGRISAPDQTFLLITALTTDQADNLYVADNNGMFKFGADGTFIKSWPSKVNFGTDPGLPQFTASGLGADGANNIYALFQADYASTIIKYTSDGQELWRKDGSDPQTKAVPSPTLAVDRAGNLYTVDNQFDTKISQQLRKLDSNGQLIWRYANIGTARGQFYGGKVAVDDQNILWLTQDGTLKFRQPTAKP